MRTTRRCWRGWLRYYHACLKRTPAALAYLERRGIADAAAIDTFKLGFADRTLGLRLPDKRRKEGAELRRGWSGWAVRESGHEHFSGSLVDPGARRGGPGRGDVWPQDH